MTPAVLSEQVRTLYSQSVPVLLANVANATIVTAALWESAPRPLLLGWTGLMALMTAARLVLRHRYWRAAPPAEEAERWGRRFVAGSAVAGVLWGAAGATFFDGNTLLPQVLITFVIGGMGAGAAGTLACYPLAFWAYLAPAVVPLATRLLLVGDRLHMAMAAMVAVYAAGLTVVTRNNHASITAAFRLRFENDGLLAELRAAQRRLEETNRTLEQRVAERSAALEQQAEALRHAQRIEAVGRLAGGIAHDFNNLLTVVLANVALLLREKPLDETGRSAVNDIQAAAVRGAELVRQLLTFSRRQEVAPRVLDLNQLVQDARRLLVRLIDERVEVRMSLAPGQVLVRADPGQLEQVVVNLATNARDAMPRGGRLTVSTSTVVADGDAKLPAGRYAVLSVDDTGVGMDAETRRRAFEPFFTTKEIGQGTGLGLSTVYGIVAESGGRVVVRSEPGHGSGFDVYLPLATEADRTEQPGEPGVQRLPAAVGATILLAEDEPEVRAVTAQMLRLAGYDVIAAADGTQALAKARATRGPIEVLVTDLVMAQMGGLELARRLATERPGLRVLFISGYGWDEEAQQAADADLSPVAFLQKPLTFDSLTAKIATLLASGPRPPAEPTSAPRETWKG
jgi:signal transduction histidine kinase/ActR/RegA family two-component response regulator